MRISADNIKAALRKVDACDLEGKERMVDEIFHAQPNLLASVLALTRLGVSYEHMDVALHILLVVHQSMLESATSWSKISQSDQERHLSRIKGRVTFTDGLNDASTRNAIQQVIDDHPEPLLYALAAERVQSWLGGLVAEAECDKYVVLCALNLVECIAHADESK